jgi:peptide/nickel transport system substrate-binding protein
MVGVLVLVSCGPAAMTMVPTTAPPTTAGPTPVPVTTPAVETPKYGGTLNVIVATDILGFDLGVGTGGYTVYLTNEQLGGGDWAKGPAGTNEVDFSMGFHGVQSLTGVLAESWEMPELGSWIFHIRRGVHYALNPASEASRLVNGRELTGEDVVFNFKRYATESRSNPRISEPPMFAAAIITQPDKWTVAVKTPVDPWTGMLAYAGHWNQPIVPPDVVNKYGDMSNWRNSVGTGPFMLTDFVPGSSATLMRNPNYWRKDPVGPGKGNQLPYTDRVNLFIITDMSSRLAAIRTARADWVGGGYSAVPWEDARGLIDAVLQLQYKRYLPSNPWVIGMRQDKQNLPFKDKRVRQALMLATNFEALKKELYGGEAEILVWPATPAKGYENVYVPMDKLPESVRALYSYKPDRAKQLLAEAGYPNGFKAKVACNNIAIDVDFLSAVKDMWSKVGVDLEVQPKEYGVYTSMRTAKTYDEMFFTQCLPFTTYPAMNNFRGTSRYNVSYVDDPHVNEVYVEVQKHMLINQPEVDRLYRELTPYVLEQAWVVPRPTSYSYVFWWPWVKNYHGEISVDWSESQTSWIPYVWIDQDLKAAR